MKRISLHTSLMSLAAAAMLTVGTAMPAHAYYYYVWRQQTVDSSEKSCARTAYRALTDAGYGNSRYDNGSASGDRNGVTINVNCIKAANDRIVAILYTISDDGNAAKRDFDWIKKVVYDRVRFDDNP